MFGKLKNMAMKKMLQSQMKNVPEDQQQMIMEMLENNPELFQKVALEMQAEMKANGNNQMAAAMKVLPKYQTEIMAAMSPEMRTKVASMMGGKMPGAFKPDGSINS
jgi:head-tail adaptor